MLHYICGMENMTSYIEEIRNKYLSSFHIIERNIQKPWGGYLVIDSKQISSFLHSFFPSIMEQLLEIPHQLSPKFLIVKPQHRLSWQYHLRREEFWRVLVGPVAVGMSRTDFEPQTPAIFEVGSLITVGSQVRHRLIGLDNIGVVAEIWKHTLPSHPSDEKDIIRVQDDFGR